MCYFFRKKNIGWKNDKILPHIILKKLDYQYNKIKIYRQKEMSEFLDTDLFYVVVVRKCHKK